MPGFSNKIAFVVPTMNRPDDLRNMLESVVSQSCLPDQIVIVDAGDITVDQVVREFPSLNTVYLREYPPSLSRQRNVGMAAVDQSISLAGYIDDDIVFEPGTIEAMLKFWENSSSDVGGARFNIMNEGLPKLIWLRSLFLIESRTRGALMPSGFQSSISVMKDTTWVRWLSGGATIWRRSVIDEFKYDEWFQGTGYLEDLDYSFNVGIKYKMAVVADAQVQHLSHPLRKDMNYVLGKWQAINRMYFIRKHEQFSTALYYWAMLGEFCFNLLASISERNSSRLNRAWGNIAGLSYVACGKLERIGGVFK